MRHGLGRVRAASEPRLESLGSLAPAGGEAVGSRCTSAQVINLTKVPLQQVIFETPASNGSCTDAMT